MYYPVGRFGGAPPLLIPSTIWNPLDAWNVTLSNFNYTAEVSSGGADGSRPHAAWDNAEITSELKYWEVHIETGVSEDQNHPVLSFGMRLYLDAMGRTCALGDISNSYENRELRYVSDGPGHIETTTIPDIAVWHSNPGKAPFTIHDLIEVAGNYLTCDPTGVEGFEGGDNLCFAFNRLTGNLWLGKVIDGVATWFNSGDPENGINPQFSNMDCSEAQYFGSEVPWRFFFATTGINYATNPWRFNLATGNNIFPQKATPPVGFDGLTDPASTNIIGNVWSYRDSSGDWMTVTPFLANTSCWFGGGTIALNSANNYALSGGTMFLGNKYYFEMVCPTTGPQTWLGIALIGNSGTGDQNSGVVCLWNQAGTLADGTGSITINTTGVLGWHLDGSERLRIAVDLVNGKVWLGKVVAGVESWFNGGDPENGTNPQFENLPLTNNWVGKGVVISNAREVDYNVSAAHYLGSTPVGFKTTIPLIETFVAP